MAYDEALADRIRDLWVGRTDVVEKRMFGGLCFMVAGHMTAGVVGDDLMVRTGKEQHDALVQAPGASTMNFTGKPMRAMLVVTADALDSDDTLTRWLERALDFTGTLPPK